MKIKIIGSGWFGCHVALTLLRDGHEVELHEMNDQIFTGASGKIPARLHLGATHYPRSMLTQEACLSHKEEFMAEYGHVTGSVPINIYAIASDHSMLDFGTYHFIVKDKCEILTVYDPAELGLYNVEGAVMTGERHIIVDKSKAYFEKELKDVLFFNSNDFSEDGYDWVIDCTFCSQDAYMIDRFEPCLVPLLEGDATKAVTIMDGPFPSLYPWNPEKNLLSLSSAKYSPFSKSIKTWAEARHLLDNLTKEEVEKQATDMVNSMAHFYPRVKDFKVVDHMLSIRAMPLSAADTRLVHVVKQSDKRIRIRAGKIDAVVEAGREVKRLMNE